MSDAFTLVTPFNEFALVLSPQEKKQAIRDCKYAYMHLHILEEKRFSEKEKKIFLKR